MAWRFLVAVIGSWAIPALAASVTAIPPSSPLGPNMSTAMPNQPLSSSTNFVGGGVSESSPAPTPPAVHETLPSTDGSTLYRAAAIPDSNPGTPENQVKSPSFNVDPYSQGPDRSDFGAGAYSNAFRINHP